MYKALQSGSIKYLNSQTNADLIELIESMTSVLFKDFGLNKARMVFTLKARQNLLHENKSNLIKIIDELEELLTKLNTA